MITALQWRKFSKEEICVLQRLGKALWIYLTLVIYLLINYLCVYLFIFCFQDLLSNYFVPKANHFLPLLLLIWRYLEKLQQKALKLEPLPINHLGYLVTPCISQQHPPLFSACFSSYYGSFEITSNFENTGIIKLHCQLSKLRQLERNLNHAKLPSLVHCKAVEDYKTGFSSKPFTRGLGTSTTWMRKALSWLLLALSVSY